MRRLLELKDIDAGYVASHSSTIVVACANLSLYSGQVVSLLGANGAGKSTLLRTVAGTQSSLRGEVLVEGRPLSRMRRKDLSRMVSVVTTDRTQAGGLTVEELVGLGRQPHTGFLGRLDSHDRQVVKGAMDAVGIGHMANKFVAELSDGERQKTMIARAVAQQTPVILLDEPTSFLDVASRVDVLQLLHRLAREEGKAILLSSHDVSLSLSLSDRLWLLMPGGHIEEGLTEDIVLSGLMNDLFANRSVRFDALTGDFSAIQTDASRTVSLQCSDTALRHWTSNALMRNGIVISADADTTITASSATDISVNGRRCGSIAETLRALEVEA